MRTLRVKFVRESEFRKFRNHLPLLALTSRTTDEFRVVDFDVPDETAATELRNFLYDHEGWQGAGPFCSRDYRHGPSTYIERDQEWRCARVGCRELVTTHIDYIPMRQFIRTAGHVNVASGRLSAKELNTANPPRSFEPMKHVLPNEFNRPSVQPRMPEKEYSQAQADALLKRWGEAWPDLERQLRQDVDKTKPDPSPPVEPIKQTVLVLELEKVADKAFRFLAGVNFQDHPISEQRESLVILRELKDVLRRLRPGKGGKEA